MQCITIYYKGTVVMRFDFFNSSEYAKLIMCKITNVQTTTRIFQLTNAVSPRCQPELIYVHYERTIVKPHFNYLGE